MTAHIVTTSRRDFLKSAATGAGLATFGRLEAALAAPSTPPNVVLLISDDQGWGDYGFMGHADIETPRIDQLAAESRTYTRGYVASPLCCPSLASMITGLHPHQHKITCNDPPAVPGDKRWTEARLKKRFEYIAHIDSAPKLPDLLKQKGYLSLQTGKWWLGHYSRGGFTHGMTHGDPERGGRHGDAGLAIGRETMQPIYDFIDEAGDRPYFLWYAPMMPHLPHNPPERFFAKYRTKTDSEFVARYWAMCEWWDETCGALLDYIDKKGQTRNTIVLYVCDNGWIQRQESRLSAPRSKLSPYEGGVRTPIMVRWPGHVEPGRDDTTLTSSIDLAPTILEACGLEPAPGMQGVSLLNHERLKQRAAVFGVSYAHNYRDIQDPVQNIMALYVIAGEWKLIAPAGPEPRGESQLYHVVEDPEEKNDLSGAHPERVEALEQLLREWWPEGAATMT